MKRKTIINISFGLVTLTLLIWLTILIFVEPWVEKRIVAVLNEKSKNYKIEVGKVNISMVKSRIELEHIKILSNQEFTENQFVSIEIASIKLNGIHILKAIFKKDMDIREVIVTNCNVKGKIPFLKKSLPPIVSPLNIRIGSIIFDKVDLTIRNALNAQFYSVKEGVFKFYDLQVEKYDTLSPSIIKQFDLEANEFFTISTDSMYSFKITNINYSTSSKTLSVKTLSVHPNYKDYDFTSHYKFQTNRFEIEISNIYAHNFNAADYLCSRNIISSYVEIGKLDMQVFRDKRKQFKHMIKPTFQDMIYNFPGIINIDSIGLLNGNINYKVHAAKAIEPGKISFNEIHTRIYKITNDTMYRSKKAFLELKVDALIMGKSKFTALLKGPIFDKYNTFSVNGTLSGMEIHDLNPILENTAFIYAMGKIDAVKFNFTANNFSSKGKLVILYHGLNIAVKNKLTNDVTAFRERFISLVINKKVIDSNPIPGEIVRVGIIDYERDPERFLFSYGFKSILSGIKYSLIQTPKKRKN